MMKMKNLGLVGIVLLGLAFTACSKEEDNGVLLTCADITYSTHIMRDYDPMPKDGWSIVIQDTYGNYYDSLVQLEVLGKELGYFI